MKINSNKVKNVFSELARYMILIGLCFVIVYPLFVKLSLSIMSLENFSDATVRYFPKTLTLNNYSKAIEHLDYLKSMGSTVLFTLGLAFVQVFSSMFIAYGLSRFKIFGNKFLLFSVILTMIVPTQAISLPLYFRFRFFDIAGIFNAILGEPLSLLNNPISLFVITITGVGLRSGLIIFIFKQFYTGFPTELEESARIDGASSIRTFCSIIVPASLSVALTTFLFSAVWHWTDGYYSSIFIPNNNFLQKKLEMLVIAVKTSMVVADAQVDVYQASLYNNAGIVLFIAPILILYFICQRYFVEGIERSGIVG